MSDDFFGVHWMSAVAFHQFRTARALSLEWRVGRSAGRRVTGKLFQRASPGVRRRLLDGSVSLESTTSLGTDVPLEQETDTFNWFKMWYPVHLIENLHTDRPNRIQLLGEFFVAWKSKKGEWVVMKDMCPHRLAPLSEGRIEEDGTLMCSYHGWRFNECGTCVKIPQADDVKSHETACNSGRATAVVYPCKTALGSLWVWPDASGSSIAEAENTVLPIPEDIRLRLERKLDMGLNSGYVRTLPYSFGILMENVADPSHVYFSHHGTVAGSRDMAGSLQMKKAEPQHPNSLASVTYDRATRAEPKRCRVEVTAPHALFLSFGEEETSSSALNFVVPVDKTNTRLLAFFVPSESTGNGVLANVFVGILKSFPWIAHVVNSQTLDGDNVFLHEIDRYLTSSGKMHWTPLTYFTPTSADLLVNTYRLWLSTKGGGGPMMITGELPSVSRKELLDRYDSHVVECKVCQDGLRFLNKTVAVCKFLSQFALLACAALAFKSAQGTLSYWKAALPLIPWALFAFVEKQIREKLIPQFYFVDYVHAEKN